MCFGCSFTFFCENVWYKYDGITWRSNGYQWISTPSCPSCRHLLLWSTQHWWTFNHWSNTSLIFRWCLQNQRFNCKFFICNLCNLHIWFRRFSENNFLQPFHPSLFVNSQIGPFEPIIMNFKSVALILFWNLLKMGLALLILIFLIPYLLRMF